MSGWLVEWLVLWEILFKEHLLREHLLRKRMFSFGHCLNYLSFIVQNVRGNIRWLTLSGTQGRADLIDPDHLRLNAAHHHYLKFSMKKVKVLKNVCVCENNP